MKLLPVSVNNNLARKGRRDLESKLRDFVRNSEVPGSFLEAWSHFVKITILEYQRLIKSLDLIPKIEKREKKVFSLIATTSSSLGLTLLNST